MWLGAKTCNIAAGDTRARRDAILDQRPVQPESAKEKHCRLPPWVLAVLSELSVIFPLSKESLS